MKQIFLLFSIIFISNMVIAQEYFLIEGKVLTKKDKKGIAFAHVGVISQGIGTVSNEQGEFIFKVPKTIQDDTLQISSIGFQTKHIALQLIQSNSINVFTLEVDIKTLEEVTVSQNSAESIVRQAINKIPENYDFGSVSYQAFARQIVFLSGEKISLVETVMDVFLHKKKLPRFDVKKLRARYYTNEGQKWLRKERLTGISALQVYNIQFPPDYLELRKMKKYKYILLDIKRQGKDTIYVIKPKYKNENHYHNEHEIHISSDNYAILFYGKNQSNNIITKSGASVFFKKFGDKYYLSRVSRIIRSQDTYMLKTGKESVYKYEHVVTKVTPNTPRISKKEEDNLVAFVKPKISDFNDSFWKNYNVIKLAEQEIEFIKDREDDVNLIEKQEILPDNLIISGRQVMEKKAFSLDFPSKPTYQAKALETPNGTLKYLQLSVEKEADLGNTFYDALIYTLWIVDFSSNDIYKSKQFVTSFLNQLDLDIDQRLDVSLSGYSGEILEGELDEIYHHTRYFQVDKRLYILSILRPESNIHRNLIDTFMGSFKILK